MIEWAEQWYIDKIKEKLLSQTRRNESGCLEWIGKTTDGVGYGLIGFLGEQVRVHRLMWEIHNKRPITKGMYCCHKCDNRKCVEPEHLYEGTPSDNQSDRISRGRQGENCGGQSRFYEGEVWLMKKLSGKVSHRMMAKMFKTTSSNISRLINDKIKPKVLRETSSSDEKG